MSFQKAINFVFTQGFIGEVIADGPSRVASFRLDDQVTTPNTIGHAYTYSADSTSVGGSQGSQVVTVGGIGEFAGIAVYPKHYALQGTTAAGALAPSLDLPPHSQVQLMTMGQIVVALSNAAAFGDPVFFDVLTGELGAGTAALGQTQIPNARAR